jgi:hypothetical protein
VVDLSVVIFLADGAVISVARGVAIVYLFSFH